MPPDVPADVPGPGSPEPRPWQRDLDPALWRTQDERRSRLVPQGQAALKRLDARAVRSGRLSPQPYNLTISHRHRFVWFQVAKAATRTVLYHLNERGVALEVWGALRVRYPTELFADYTSFAVVRHPQTRLVSAWRDKVVNQNYFDFSEREHRQMQDLASFVAWVADQPLRDVGSVDQHIALQTRLVDLNEVDLLGRVETLDVDLPRICRAIGVPSPDETTRRLNVSAGPPPDVAPAVLARVADVYRRDFEILGYEPA